MMNRRKFLTGALAAPLVVKAGVLMPVKPRVITRMVHIDHFPPPLMEVPYVRFMEQGHPAITPNRFPFDELRQAFLVPEHILKGADHV